MNWKNHPLYLAYPLKALETNQIIDDSEVSTEVSIEPSEIIKEDKPQKVAEVKHLQAVLKKL